MWKRLNRDSFVVGGFSLLNPDFLKGLEKPVRECRRKNIVVFAVLVAGGKKRADKCLVSRFSASGVIGGSSKANVDDVHHDFTEGIEYSLSNLCHILHRRSAGGKQILRSEHDFLLSGSKRPELYRPKVWGRVSRNHMGELRSDA